MRKRGRSQRWLGGARSPCWTIRWRTSTIDAERVAAFFRVDAESDEAACGSKAGQQLVVTGRRTAFAATGREEGCGPGRAYLCGESRA